jgi:hypothetical protein
LQAKWEENMMTRSRILMLTIFAFLLLVSWPQAEASQQSIISVAPPNGSDDTDNIQAALNACVAKGPGCTVQLQAGTYLTRQLVTYNFQGTFKGMALQTQLLALTTFRRENHLFLSKNI